MTGDIDQFFTLESKDEGSVTFGDNHKGRIIGIGKIKITPTFIENVLLVDKLKHNLLSISQLYDVGFNVFFKTSMCIVVDPLTLTQNLLDIDLTMFMWWILMIWHYLVVQVL